ncbi:hypothetical protein BaRGS_00040020 [Batillaria attramentaria]|uniref:Uncharacterized protein n=1 Tax=Batillaria attramentaria TaxID=370345 RepID=A0ABD0J2G0_9CAEN
MADSATGNLSSFEICLRSNREKGQTRFVVERLTQHLHFQHHILYANRLHVTGACKLSSEGGHLHVRISECNAPQYATRPQSG